VTGEFTLVDVDLDEAKGWYIHGTNGTVVPTKDEFIHVLTTLQMILLRMDYYPSIYVKNNSNYDDLGLAITTQDPYEYMNDQIKGENHTKEYKRGLDLGKHPYGQNSDRIGTYRQGLMDHTITAPAHLGTNGPMNTSRGVWKTVEDPKQLGRLQVHGEIVAIKEVEMFESFTPLQHEFLNSKVEGRLPFVTSCLFILILILIFILKVEGRLRCWVDPVLGEMCEESPTPAEAEGIPPLPAHDFNIPTPYVDGVHGDPFTSRVGTDPFDHAYDKTQPFTVY